MHLGCTIDGENTYIWWEYIYVYYIFICLSKYIFLSNENIWSIPPLRLRHLPCGHIWLVLSDLLEHQITFRHYCNAYVGAWLVHDDTYLDSAGLPLSAKDTPCFICCLKWPKHDICNFAVFLASFTYPNISFIPSWFLLCEWYERLPNMMGGVFIAAIYPPLCPFIGTHCLMDPKPHFRLIFSLF